VAVARSLGTEVARVSAGGMTCSGLGSCPSCCSGTTAEARRATATAELASCMDATGTPSSRGLMGTEYRPQGKELVG
jgi:hypothetical protein